MKSENSIRRDWDELDGFDGIMEAIRHQELSSVEYIADIVCSLCNVKKEELFDLHCKSPRIAHVRWFYWYTLRYMTGETLEKIASMIYSHHGVKSKFTSTLSRGCNLMNDLIAKSPLWQRRWNIVKHVIKLRDNGKQQEDNTIVIRVPRGLMDVIKIEVKPKDK